jgi:probable DNA metabolism protein
MRKSLFDLFSMLNDNLPVSADSEHDLFGFADAQDSFQYKQADIDFLIFYFSSEFDSSLLDEKTRALFELSVNAFDVIIYAWMSELPIEAEIIAFGRRVIAQAETAEGGLEEKRQSAQRAAEDRGDSCTLTVLNAAAKVQFEAHHRMTGLLRFYPNEHGCYVARCEPDHFILPALGEYFTARFGETAWQIIDEKRGFCLSRQPPETAKLQKTAERADFAENSDEWEDLWRHYHKTINNESRNNPNLQRQFMPQRYWKYLSEMKNDK